MDNFIIPPTKKNKKGFSKRERIGAMKKSVGDVYIVAPMKRPIRQIEWVDS